MTAVFFSNFRTRTLVGMIGIDMGQSTIDAYRTFSDNAYRSFQIFMRSFLYPETLFGLGG